MPTKPSRPELVALEKISGAGGTVRAPKFGVEYAEVDGKPIARTTLEMLVYNGFVSRYPRLDSTRWIITQAGRDALKARARKSDKPPSPAQLDRELATFFDWKARVRAIVKASSFEEETPYGGSPDSLYFATRANGDVGEERPGRADIEAARALREQVQREIPGVKGSIDTVDEWTNLSFKKA